MLLIIFAVFGLLLGYRLGTDSSGICDDRDGINRLGRFADGASFDQQRPVVHDDAADGHRVHRRDIHVVRRVGSTELS